MCYDVNSIVLAAILFFIVVMSYLRDFWTFIIYFDVITFASKAQRSRGGYNMASSVYKA